MGGTERLRLLRELDSSMVTVVTTAAATAYEAEAETEAATVATTGVHHVDRPRRRALRVIEEIHDRC